MNRKERRYKDKLQRKEQEKFERSQAKIKTKPHLVLTKEQVERFQEHLNKDRPDAHRQES